MLVNVAVVGRIWQNDCLQESNGALNATPFDTVAFANSVLLMFWTLGTSVTHEMHPANNNKEEALPKGPLERISQKLCGPAESKLQLFVWGVDTH
jgi:hypothetical protein